MDFVDSKSSGVKKAVWADWVISCGEEGYGDLRAGLGRATLGIDDVEILSIGA